MSSNRRPSDHLSSSAPMLVALLLGAFVFRPQLAIMGPLAPSIRDSLGASHAFVGLLTTIPVLCMGLFAPFGPLLARRTGAGWGIVVAASVIALAGVLRGVLASEAAMLVTTVIIGIATALSGPLQAMFVRSRLTDHVVAGTAAYAGGTTAGAALAAALAVPLALVLGGWQGSLIAVSLLSLIGLPLFVVQLRRGRTTTARPREDAGIHLPLRRPAVWGLGLIFGLQSILYYGTGAWLPSVYVELGWDPALAAALVSLSSIAGFVAILAVPVVNRKGIGRRSLFTGATVACSIGMLGVAAMPAPGFLWAVVLGIGMGMTFTLVQTLPSDVGRDARETGGAAALMLLVGYMLAAGGPIALGAARDLSGSFGTGMWVLVAIAVVMVPLSWMLAPQRMRAAPQA